MKVRNYVDSDDWFAFQVFWAVSWVQALYQSSMNKSRQNRFVTKITGESVLNNLIDL